MNLLEVSSGSIAFIVVGVLLLVFALMCISYHNKFVGLKNNAKEAFSTMDVYLKKRYDLIPNIVETVKGYAKHEKQTLVEVIEARNKAASASTPQEKLDGDNQVTGALRQLFALAEQYPDLKANQNYLELQSSLKDVEKDIANSRKYYNGNVKALNNAVQMFPGNIFAKMFHAEAMPLFEVESVEERNNVRVSFD